MGDLAGQEYFEDSSWHSCRDKRDKRHLTTTWWWLLWGQFCQNIITVSEPVFMLFAFRLSPAPEKSSKYQWTFKLVHLQPEKRTYYFAAYSEREMNVSTFWTVFQIWSYFAASKHKPNSWNKLKELIYENHILEQGSNFPYNHSLKWNPSDVLIEAVVTVL